MISFLMFLAVGFAEPEAMDALAEVNTVRQAKGLSPFVRDDQLTLVATEAARFRANALMAGHTSNDFGFLPAGTSASAAGCAAWEPEWGWGSCCTYDNYTHAGAAFAVGSDGRRYMHLFVSGGGGGNSHVQQFYNSRSRRYRR